MNRYKRIFIICGLILAFRSWQARDSFENQRGLFPRPQKGVFQAWVAEEPEVLFPHEPGSHDTGRLNGNYQPWVREVRAVCVVFSFDGKPVAPVRSRLTFRLSPEAAQPVLSYGETIEVEGKIERPSPAMNPGQFDYAHYLKTKGVAYVMYVAPGKWSRSEVDGTQGWTFLRWSYGLKRQAEDRIYRYLPFPENALLNGILLGVRSPLPEDIIQSFFLTGTIHILAVSGLITAFIAGLMFMVCRALQLSRKWAAGATLVGLAFFVFMTGAHPPVCRAGLFSAMALLAIFFERRLHGGTLLLATALLLVGWNPFVLEDLSFQISFIATAGLMVMTPWFMEKLAFLWKPAALLVTATTAAQLAVWCLIIYDFNQFSFYSIFSNLIIVPLALFSTAAGLALLAGSLVHPFLGTLLGAACEAPLKLLVFLADWMARWPKAEWIVASPPTAWVLLFHGLLLFSFLCYWPGRVPEKPSESWKRRRNLFLKGRRLAMAGGILYLGGAAIALLAFSRGSQSLRVTFLAVGHGNAVVLRSPGGQVLVVDGGRGTHGSDRFNLAASYLRHVGVGKVGGVLDTHPDEDHLGGLVNIMGAYPTDSAYEGTQAQADTGVYRDFKETILKRKVRLAVLKEGDHLGELDPAKVTILHPPDHYVPRLHADNNRSLVSLVSFGGFNLVLPGDLEKDGLLKLLKDNQPFPKVDWLMAPHHGRRSGEPRLCAQGFKPRFVVLSDWRDYPDDRAIFQGAVPGAVVLSTAEEGAIEVELNRNGSGRYRTFRNAQWGSFDAEKMTEP